MQVYQLILLPVAYRIIIPTLPRRGPELAVYESPVTQWPTRKHQFMLKPAAI